MPVRVSKVNSGLDAMNNSRKSIPHYTLTFPSQAATNLCKNYRFGGLSPLFLYLFTIYSYNHSFTTLAEDLLHIFTDAGSVGGPSMGCRAEIRTRACLTAGQRITV
jgi:hypothetical protein